MENSTKKSGGLVIPKRKRSLDLKSLYESRSSDVGGSKRNDSGENEQEDVRKKKRKSRKEVSLSSFEPDTKKRRKDDENGTESEAGFREKLDGWSKGLHGISLTLGDNGSPFNIPKRPRGWVGQKKLESDQGSEPLKLSNSVDRAAGAFKAEVSKYVDKGGPSDQLVRSVTLSAGKGGVSKSRLAGKVVGSNTKSKQKADSKSTMNGSSSSVKLKKKMGAAEAIDRVRAFKAALTKSRDKSGPSDQSVRSVILPACNDVAGKVIGLNKKSKRKADPKSTLNSDSSNMKLKKVGADEACDPVGASEAEVTKPEDKGGPSDESVRSLTLSAGKNVAGKVVGLNKKSKQKADPKSTMNSSSSNVKLKKKVGADEAADRVGASEAEVTKSEVLAIPNDHSVRSLALSGGNDVASKFVGLNKKSKQKADPKSSSSNVKLKKKVGADVVVDRVGASEAEVTKSAGGPIDQSVRPLTISLGNDVAGKVVGINKKSKQKVDPKSTMNSSSSNVKLKKAGVDEAVDRKGALEAEITKSEGEGGPNDQSVRSLALSAGNNVAVNVVGLNKKSKRKADLMSTMNSSSSNVKLKKKVGANKAIDREGAFESEIPKSEDKGGSNDQSARSFTLSAGNDEADKVVHFNKKSKRKVDPKSTMISSNSNGKLKKKLGADESIDRVGISEAEVTKSEGRGGGRKDKLVKSVTPSTGKDGIPDSRLVGKVAGLNTKSKQKTDSKSTIIPSSSNVKLKKMVEDDEDDVCVGAYKAEVTKSEDKGGRNDQLDRQITLSAGKDGIPNLKLAGKSVASDTKSKRKGDAKSTMNSRSSNVKLKQKVGADAKSTMNSGSSNVKLKQKVGADEVKETNDCQSDSVQHVVKESNPVVNNGDTSSKKRRRISQKKKDLVVRGDGVEASIKKLEPALGSSVSNTPFLDSLDDDDDDEENLEQNAARMLSSRFDPSCTGFASKRRSSVSQTADELSFPDSSARDSVSRQAKSLGGGESASGDDKSRALRPRGGDKGNGVSRRRRHFYEIPTGDLEPSWVLNRRIKIFWPLDESWYYGHVIDYHSEAKLHHLKYDDGEEEWVNLEEENFRLLLLRSEVPGKGKSRKRCTGAKDTPTEQTVPPADENSCEDLDSEPIAAWLASQSQRVKSFSKSTKRRKHLPLVSSLSSERSDNPNGDADASKLIGKMPGCESMSGDKTLVCETVDRSPVIQIEKHFVYVRKKYQNKSSGSISVSRVANACESAPGSVTPLFSIAVSLPTTRGDMFDFGCAKDSDKQQWSFDDRNKSKLNIVFLESTDFSIQICLSYKGFSRGIGFFRLFHDIFMLQHGVIMTTSPAVFMEMLFVDSDLGLRSLLFEGCLMQALAIVLLTLSVFSHSSDEHWKGKLKLPVTSIRFQLSSVHDLKKQHVFAFYSFSRLERSKWLYLESKILQQCLLLKQLSISECTYGNIKDLECGISQPRKPRVGSEVCSREDFRKKFELGILPMGGISRDAFNTRMSQSAFSLTGKPGNVPQFALSFSAPSNLFLGLHLQSLMEHGCDRANLQHQDPPWSPESSGNGDEPIAECSQPIEHESSQLDLDSDLGMGLVLACDASENTNSSDKLQRGLSGYQQNDMPFARKGRISRQTSDASWDVHDGFVLNSNTMGSKSSSKRRRSSTISSLLGHLSPVSADSQPNFMRDGFNGPRKPRTQVQYTLPLVGYDFSTKQETSSPRSIPCKRIRRASLKRASDGSGNNQKNLDLVTCFANVLVTHGDKGWRECGAHIVLEISDHNEWRLAIKLAGTTKFSYKVTHILQLGSTNRYSHAVIWKGGKDWILEFPERSQWNLFKEMYEECYNRNVRAASVKNIPIPGVRLVEESDDYGDEVPFVRNPAMYFRQIQTDAEMAMDPSHILYDMDSDDEQWLITHKNCTDKHEHEEILEEFFEIAVDMFEKVSYAQRRDTLTDVEVEELAIGIGSVEAAKLIYLYWRQKREKMRVPLIRHFQPPPWERYQKQLKEWEHNVARSSQERVPASEKPPMFAFCLKPRGLDVPNKASKQRSHRKLSVSGLHAFSGDHSLIVSGRRSNGHAFGDERALYPSSIHDSSDVSPSLHPSTRVLSSRDAHFTLSASVSEWKVNNHRKAHKNKRKKLGSYHRTTEDNHGVQQWNVGPPELPSPRHHYFNGPNKQGGATLPDISDLHEFHIRDALGASQHARNLAKLKREAAQKLFCKADLAIQKAVNALMKAEAIKDSSENSNGVN